MVSIAAGVWEGPGYAFRLRLCPFCGTTSFCATDRKRVMLGEACADKQEEKSNRDFGSFVTGDVRGLYEVRWDPTWGNKVRKERG